MYFKMQTKSLKMNRGRRLRSVWMTGGYLCIILRHMSHTTTAWFPTRAGIVRVRPTGQTAGGCPSGPAPRFPTGSDACPSVLASRAVFRRAGGGRSGERSRPSLPGMWCEAVELVWASILGYLTLPQPDRKVGVAPPPFLLRPSWAVVPTAHFCLPLSGFAGPPSVASARAWGWERLRRPGTAPPGP